MRNWRERDKKGKRIEFCLKASIYWASFFFFFFWNLEVSESTFIQCYIAVKIYLFLEWNEKVNMAYLYFSSLFDLKYTRREGGILKRIEFISSFFCRRFCWDGTGGTLVPYGLPSAVTMVRPAVVATPSYPFSGKTKFLDCHSQVIKE